MMAVDLHNTELLLPSQFFTEDNNILPVSDKSINHNNNSNSSSFFSSSDFESDLSSPLRSELGSTETEESSEEEDDCINIAELTRQMAHYMFQDDDKNEKSWGFSGSPQSTLWSPFGSSHESPRGSSREPSPPLTPMIGNFEKMKINEEIPKYNHGEASVPLTMKNPNVGFQSKQALIDDQIRAIQFYRLKQEQIMKQLAHKQQAKYYHNKGRACGGFNNRQKPRTHQGSSANPWITLQQQQQQQQQQQPQQQQRNNNNNQQTASGMRAVFLGGSGSGTGSSGTGVFLPRGIGTPCESRKKTGCAPVLIPARVVQALKLHFDKVGVPSRFSAGFPLHNDTLMDERNSSFSQQKRHSRAAPAMNHQEMGLPQEWTY